MPDICRVKGMRSFLRIWPAPRTLTVLQRHHALLDGDLADRVGGKTLHDGGADVVGDGQHLHDGATPLVAAAVALRAAHRVVDGGAVEGVRVDLVGLEHLRVERPLHRRLAVGAEAAVEALRLGEDERRGEQERRDAHVDETGDDAGGVVGVQRREHQVARERGLHGDVGRLAVADLADEADVRVLAQHRAQHRGEREADLLVHGDLVDARQLVLDRVLGGDDVHVRLVEVLEAGVERRRLARAGRPRHEDDAVRLVDRVLHRAVGEVVEAQRGEARREVRLVERTHDDLLAVDRREDGDADVDLLAHRLHLEAAVLRDAALGDVEVGHDLDAGDDRVVQGLGRRRALDERAVDAVAQARGLLHRLEVDVGGAGAQRLARRA